MEDYMRANGLVRVSIAKSFIACYAFYYTLGVLYFTVKAGVGWKRSYFVVRVQFFCPFVFL